jgi:hypothetical protein
MATGTRRKGAAGTARSANAREEVSASSSVPTVAVSAENEGVNKDKDIVLVTGASGFVGRYVLKELLAQSVSKHFDTEIDGRDIYDGNACKYDQIIAVDMCSAEAIAKVVEFSPFVLPLQIDLRRLLDSSSQESAILRNLLPTVTTVIHIAGIVDTRETEGSRRLLQVSIVSELSRHFVILVLACSGS